MNRTLMLAVVLSSFVSFACDKTDTPATPPTNTATQTTNAQTQGAQPSPAQAPAPIALADSDLSTPADFEEEAEKAITSKNYKAELASLETDVSKE